MIHRVLGLVCSVAFASACTAQSASAEQLIADGHWKQARTIVERRFREAPKDAAAHFYLSQIRNAFGDRSSPLPLAEQAVALDGHVAKYHRQIAEVLGVMAQHSNMVQQLFLARRFRKEIGVALTLDPHDVQALRDLVEFYLLAPGIAGGDTRKAQATAERIVAVDRAEGFIANARISIFEKRNLDAETWLKKAAAIEPASYRARIALAQFEVSPEHANLPAAEAAAQDAVRLDRGRADAYAILACIYARQQRFEALDALLQEASRAVPDDLVAYFRAAEGLVAARRDFGRAASYIRKYLAQEPEGNEPSLADARQLLDRIAQNGT